MTYSLRFWALLLGFGASLLTSATSCSKKADDPAPTATTGAIEGTVSPAGSLTTVTATNGGGLTFVTTPNATTGAFSLANLAPGAYTLSFIPASGFTTPASRTAAVTAGQTTAAGTVLVTPIPQGSIGGSITPAEAVTRVEAVSSAGVVVSATPNSGGAFSFSGLSLGNYTVRFVMAPGFDALPDLTAVLTATDPNASLGNVQAQRGGSIRSGTMNWTANGATYSTSNVTGGFSAPSGSMPLLQYTATATNGADTAILRVTLGGYSLGVGTYSLGGVYQNLSYQVLRGGNVVEEYNYGGATGSFTIAAYDSSTGVATGTFGYTISGPNSSRMVISNGSFNLRF